MRTRMLFLLVAVMLAACTAQQRKAPAPEQARQVATGVLLLGSSTGVTSVDAATGRVVSQTAGVPPLGDWSEVFTTTLSGGKTILEARDASTGGVASRVSLAGELSVRVVSGDGSQVALMAPLPEGSDPWVPVPRARTTMVVADPDGSQEPTRYRLRGNFEPEAFSTFGDSLFLIKFVPPTDPVAYRVARLDLAKGKVFPVGTGQKGVVETMSGTRLEQTSSPDGDMLYTLYTTQPAAYAHGHAKNGSPVAFVHTLNLDEGWAHCVVLPKSLWGADPAHEAMAVSPDLDLLYVVDTARDLVAVMNTERLEVVVTEEFDIGPVGGGETSAVVAPDGNLIVAAGSKVVALDTSTLRPVRTWTTDARVSALGTGPDVVYVAMPGKVMIIDPSTGRRTASIPSPAGEGMSFVGVVAAS
jgi:hypothetical protein